MTIPGIGKRTAEVVVAEIGVDMSRFSTAGHLASWAGMCPGNHDSAGKRRSGKARKGNAALRTTLTEAAWTTAHTRTYLGSQYRRFCRRFGKKAEAKAAFAGRRGRSAPTGRGFRRVRRARGAAVVGVRRPAACGTDMGRDPGGIMRIPWDVANARTRQSGHGPDKPAPRTGSPVLIFGAPLS